MFLVKTKDIFDLNTPNHDQIHLSKIKVCQSVIWAPLYLRPSPAVPRWPALLPSHHLKSCKVCR